MTEGVLTSSLMDASGAHFDRHGEVSLNSGCDLRVVTQRYASSCRVTEVTLRLSGDAMFLMLELTQLQAVVLARALDVAARTAQAVDAQVAQRSDRATGGSIGPQQTVLGTKRKDGVAAVPHGGFVLQFVHKAKGLQGGDHAHKVAQTADFDGAVELPLRVAHAQRHDVPAQVRTGVFFDGSEYLVVHGQRLYTFDELGGQGGSFTGLDAAGLRATLRYVRKVCDGLHTDTQHSKGGAA